MDYRAKLQQAVNSLIGKRLWGCARATNMVMFQFGEARAITDQLGREKEVGEFALHVQCPWRIAVDDRVIVGSRDINYPADYSEGDEIPESFDWDKDRTRLDRLIDFFLHESTNLRVRDIKAGRAASLCIAVGENLYLDVFPNDSLPSEHWRLLEPGKKVPHFVAARIEP